MRLREATGSGAAAGGGAWRAGRGRPGPAGGPIILYNMILYEIISYDIIAYYIRLECIDYTISYNIP